MSRKILKITLFSVLIIAALSYVFVLNPEAVNVTYRPGHQWSLPLAMVLVVTFSIGAIFSTLWWLLVGLRYHLRERQLAKSARQVEEHHSALVLAREELALGNYERARGMLSRVLDRDPRNVAASIHLAETFRCEGNTLQALRVLEQARAADGPHAELLFFAAELNAELGNHTAAFDNMSLVLSAHPKSTNTLMRLTEESEALGRYADAIEFQRQLVRLLPYEQQSDAQERLAALELKQIASTTAPGTKERSHAVEDLLRRHRDFPPALEELAECELAVGRPEEATKLLTRSYRARPRTSVLERLARHWLDLEQPQRATAVVKSLVYANEVPPQAAREGKLFYAGLLLFLENTEAARTELSLLKRETEAAPSLARPVELLELLLKHRMGESDEAFERLFALVAEELGLPGYFGSRRHETSENGRGRLIGGHSPKLLSYS